MTQLRQGHPEFYPTSRKEWRKWLQKNHNKLKGVWLIIFKKETGKPSVNYAQAVEEALCFGWIDGKPNKRDEESYCQFFTKRNPKSKWSKINKARVEDLIEKKLMTPAGLAAIETAKENGSWHALDDIDNLVIPEDFGTLLHKNKKALKNFESFPVSSKKIILQWIFDAKTPVTRNKRISETVKLAAKNIRANHYRNPK